jgi:hypothetical protein
MTTFVPPVIVALLFILAASLLKEPGRQQLMAILVGGAGAAYLSGGGLGIWEFVFTAVMTVFAWRGIESYRFIGTGWLLHTGWDLVHHFHGHPIIPFLPASSLGCAITDALLALWFFANVPSIFALAKRRHSSAPA